MERFLHRLDPFIEISSGGVGILDGRPVRIGGSQAKLASCQFLPMLDEFLGAFQLLVTLSLKPFPPAIWVAILDAMYRIKSLGSGHANDLADPDRPVQHEIHVVILEADVVFLSLEDCLVFFHSTSL